jgi:hypothetical protein
MVLAVMVLVVVVLAAKSDRNDSVSSVFVRSPGVSILHDACE